MDSHDSEVNRRENKSRNITSKMLKRNWPLILASLIIVAMITFPPLLINERGINLWLNWMSVGISVGATWYFSRRAFETNLTRVQRDIALVAVRRPFEISKSLTRVIQNIRSKKEAIKGMKLRGGSSLKDLIMEYLSGIELQISESQGHVNHAIADWQGLLGRDIAIVNEIFEKISSITNSHQSEIETLKQSYESALEDAKEKGDAQLSRVKSEYEQKLKEKDREYAKKISEIVERGRKESALFGTISGVDIAPALAPRTPTSFNQGGAYYFGPLAPLSSGIGPGLLPFYVQSPVSEPVHCAHCGSETYRDWTGIAHCYSCGADFATSKS